MRHPFISLPVVLSLGMLLGPGEPYGHGTEHGQAGPNLKARPMVSFQATTQEGERSEGNRLFESACTLCHDLRGITDNPGLYTEPEFRDLLVAMVEYGASLEATEIELLVVYLTETYGKRDP